MQNRRLDATGQAKLGETRGLTGTGPGLDHQEAASQVSGRFWNRTEPFFLFNLGPFVGYPDPLLSVVLADGSPGFQCNALYDCRNARFDIVFHKI